ncbi:hypothetical protein BpHYR1_012417 [Brachionus plicatilis]|uniref:Uncharacterized protein n=1 Tax=Brachionus plicatilis TaxID=10195 RepID=A0A3M7QP37_BRAPC|nr:hypothetical protein BpHYR1_012417 [Brachionus plicatilis]
MLIFDENIYHFKFFFPMSCQKWHVGNLQRDVISSASKFFSPAIKIMFMIAKIKFVRQLKKKLIAERNRSRYRAIDTLNIVGEQAESLDT